MNWYVESKLRHVEQRTDYDESVQSKPSISANQLFYNYILPTTKKLYPNFPVEHYSLSAFLNMSREETGLDNRRRHKDKTFTNAGTEIKALTNKCLSLFGKPQFDDTVNQLVHRLHKWYYDESPSGGLVERPNKRQVDYKKLYELGVKLTPQQGKMLSRSVQNSPKMQQIRNEFMDAQNALDSGDEQPIINWWTTYKDSLPTPIFEKAKPRPQIEPNITPKSQPVKMTPAEPEYDEIYDWKNDKYVKTPVKQVA